MFSDNFLSYFLKFRLVFGFECLSDFLKLVLMFCVDFFNDFSMKVSLTFQILFIFQRSGLSNQQFMPEIGKLGFGRCQLLLNGVEPGLEVIKLSNINGLELFPEGILLFD